MGRGSSPSNHGPVDGLAVDANDSGVQALSKKALIGLLKMELALGILLFVPAGSLRFWEGWIYAALLSLSGWLTTLYLLKHDPALLARRLQAGPAAEERKTQKVIQASAGILFCLLLAVPGLDHRLGWSGVPTVAVLAADLMVIVGLAIIFAVLRENSYAASVIKVEAGQQVVSTGPYRVVRHPMYAGAWLMLLATPIALGSWWGIPVGILLCASLVVRLLDEERFLSASLPGYDAYRQNVRKRLIPGIW